MPPRREKRSTVESGYGQAHRKARAAYLAAYVPGVTVCPGCGKVMTELVTRRLHLMHSPDRRSYLGLGHKVCNEAAAAHLRADRMADRAEPSRPGLDLATWDCCAGDATAAQHGMRCHGHGPGCGSGRCWYPT